MLRNDDSVADSHALTLSSLVMTESVWTATIEAIAESRNNTSLSSSLRGDLSPKQSIESCEAQPTLAPLRGAEKEEKGGSSASALLELECDIARLSPKSVPKACEHSEAKTAELFFVRLSPHISRWQVRRGAGRGCSPFCEKKRLCK